MYYWDKESCDFSVLTDKIITDIIVDDVQIDFHTDDGGHYRMVHEQDCCESVYVDDIVGDMKDLLNSRVVYAREDTSRDQEAKSDWDDSYTWTFYNIATNKGSVTIKWYGTSNGYYSESVSFIRM